MLIAAERFLVDCMPTGQSRGGAVSFNDIRHTDYHRAKLIDLGKSPCTSASLRLHIKRAYLQTYMWIHAAIIDDKILNETSYGYRKGGEEKRIPIIVEEDIIPMDFPLPCNCLKCARGKVCPCRVKDFPCCDFCKCKGVCRNP